MNVLCRRSTKRHIRENCKVLSETCFCSVLFVRMLHNTRLSLQITQIKTEPRRR